MSDLEVLVYGNDTTDYHHRRMIDQQEFDLVLESQSDGCYNRSAARRDNSMSLVTLWLRKYARCKEMGALALSA